MKPLNPISRLSATLAVKEKTLTLEDLRDFKTVKKLTRNGGKGASFKTEILLYDKKTTVYGVPMEWTSRGNFIQWTNSEFKKLCVSLLTNSKKGLIESMPFNGKEGILLYTYLD